MESLNLDFLRIATETGYGPVFRNDRYNLAVVQIEGSFTGLSLILEGRTDIDAGPWEAVAGWSVSDPNTKTETVSSAGIYEWRIEGIREFRFRILAISGGSVNASGVLYNSADNSTYPYASAPGSITFGDPALFVKGVCEQIFFDPSTGNIVGYDNTATDGSVTISVNLAEIAGGMGNRLIGVLPDTARVSGGYTSSAFSLETREKIMGGQIAYNAVVPVCEKITADSTELVVSKKPAPYYGENSIPDIRVPIYREISNTDIASFAAEDAAPLKSLTVDIEPVQSGSGDPAPDNVRPITGWTGANIHVSPTTNPADGRTYSVEFPSEAGTVYGGRLDVVNGVLTVDRAYRSLTGVENTWNSSGTGESKFFVFFIGDNGVAVDGSGICSHFPPINNPISTSTTVGQRVYNSAGFQRCAVAFRPENVAETSLADFKAWVAEQAGTGTPVQIAYQLTTPIVLRVSQTAIMAQRGTNNVWGETGDIRVLQYVSGWNTIEADGNVYRAYVAESGSGKHTGEAYGVDAKTGVILGFAAEAGKTYEVTYFAHNVSAQMLPIPSIWNPVMMTVQERYGVYAKQNGSAEKGVLKGWLYFIVPRAILNADAGESASETANATTDGNWIAIPEKPENMPFCDCDESAHPVAYYVYVPCSGENDAVVEVVSVGSGLTLKAGRTAQLPIKLVMPDDSLIQPDFTRMGYYSEDESVATVDNRGIVTAVSEGQTVVHAFVSKSDGSSLDSRTIVAVEGTRKTLTANRNNILVG